MRRPLLTRPARPSVRAPGSILPDARRAATGRGPVRPRPDRRPARGTTPRSAGGKRRGPRAGGSRRSGCRRLSPGVSWPHHDHQGPMTTRDDERLPAPGPRADGGASALVAALEAAPAAVYLLAGPDGDPVWA